MSHHKLAWALVGVTSVLIAADGLLFSFAEKIPLWHGVFCIWMTALTVGGDVTPSNGWGYFSIAFAPCPVVAAILTLFTSALAAVHVRDSEGRVTKYVEQRLRHHLGKPSV